MTFPVHRVSLEVTGWLSRGPAQPHSQAWCLGGLGGRLSELGLSAEHLPLGSPAWLPQNSQFFYMEAQDSPETQREAAKLLLIYVSRFRITLPSPCLVKQVTEASSDSRGGELDSTSQ